MSAHSDRTILTLPIEGTDCTFVAAEPTAAPKLWSRYLTGALLTYRHFGVELALEVDAIRNGEGTSLLMVGVEPSGRVIGGIRAQGPYRHADDAHALAEWAGFPGESELRQMISDRIPEGVAELKGLWVAPSSLGRRAIVEAAAQMPVAATMRILGVRHVLGTAGVDPIIDLYKSTGGIVAEQIPTAPYPSARYHATALWWDRELLGAAPSLR